MLPPPGLTPTPTAFLDDGLPTPLSVLSSAALAIATALPSSTSTLPIEIDLYATTSALLAVATKALLNEHMNEHKPDRPPPPPPPPENGECQLLGNFAILVQGVLGVAALSALVFKRWRERPQRPLKIWTFDVSKQVVGSILVHIANLLMSMLSSGQLSVQVSPDTVTGVKGRMMKEEGGYQPNPCSFYLLNLAIDVSPPQMEICLSPTDK